MTAADRLNEIEARANAATEGPWFVSEEDGSVWVDRGDGNTDGLTGELAPWATHEADFIAAARTYVPALVAALRAVLDLHRPVRVYAYAEDCGCGNEDHVIIEDEWGEDLCFDTPTGDVQCAYCRAEQSYVEHPCETVRAIEEALNA